MTYAAYKCDLRMMQPSVWETSMEHHTIRWRQIYSYKNRIGADPDLFASVLFINNYTFVEFNIALLKC